MNPECIDLLRDPALYPERPEVVEIVQTHLSVVCLVGDSAYKFKKSVRLPFADFSTLENRRHFCEEELRLNRRLCPWLYREVVTLRRDRAGRLSLVGGEGEIVDHALVMGRLPAERMLDVRLASDAVSVEDIEAIAERMSAFHREAERGPEIHENGAPEKLRGFALANFEETRQAVGTIFPADLHTALERRTRADFDRWLPILQERAGAGKIVDGHGDLHARNICLSNPLAIYDCIEFNPAFRCGDVATEHAFLLMDLRYRGHAGLASVYLNAVIAASGDDGIREMMPPLLRYRAMVRAKVSAIAAGESELSEEDRAEAGETARRYLRLAAASAIEEEGPWWLLFCGLPASGKSSIADALSCSAAGAWPVLSTDRIRKELAGRVSTEPLPEEFYSPGFSRRTYDELRARAVRASLTSRVVVLDANSRGKEERSLILRACRSVGARLAILMVEAGEETVMARLAHRATDPEAESDANCAVYRKLKAAFEVPTADEADRLIPVSGAGVEADVAADEVLAVLLSPESWFQAS